MPGVRVAACFGTCGNRACLVPIQPGMRIVKPGPGRGWEHEDCRNPGPARQSRPDMARRRR
jgi:hypothetical protein